MELLIYMNCRRDNTQLRVEREKKKLFNGLFIHHLYITKLGIFTSSRGFLFDTLNRWSVNFSRIFKDQFFGWFFDFSKMSLHWIRAMILDLLIPCVTGLEFTNNECFASKFVKVGLFLSSRIPLRWRILTASCWVASKLKNLTQGGLQKIHPRYCWPQIY